MTRKLTTEIDRQMVVSHIQRLDIKAKTYTVEVKEKRVRRTISQNALYWLWLTCISKETGNDKDELHEYFMRKYLSPKFIRIFGTETETYTTTELDTVNFKYYLDNICAFAATELAITLPDPEDKQWEEFYKYYS